MKEMEKDTKFQMSYQGSLDYFCGIYAVINAIGFASSSFKVLTFKEKCDFFQYIMLYLLDKKILERVIKKGSPCALEERYLMLAQKYMKEKHHILVQWRKLSSIAVQQKLDCEDASFVLRRWLKKERHSCIVRVKTNKMGDHWTVFRKIKFPACYLLDSYHFLKLRLANFRWRSRTKAKTNQEVQIMKQGIFLVRVANLKKRRN